MNHIERRILNSHNSLNKHIKSRWEVVKRGIRNNNGITYFVIMLYSKPFHPPNIISLCANLKRALNKTPLINTCRCQLPNASLCSAFDGLIGSSLISSLHMLLASVPAYRAGCRPCSYIHMLPVYGSP